MVFKRTFVGTHAHAFHKVFSGNPKSATLDPLGKRRVNWGSRHFWHARQLNETKTFENHGKHIPKSNRNR